jgi:AraC-like DNA-binding protein
VAEEATYKVLPDTGVVLGFQYKGRLFQVDDGISIALDTSGISGLADHHRSFRNLAGTGTIFVFFKEPGVAPFLLEKFLIGRMTRGEPDKLVLAALALIHKSKGNIRIKALAQQLHTSQSPLEKRFRAAVGASPKKFSSIVRLKNLLQQFPKTGSLTELGYEAGFYDQAHFIKEFKAFTGDTPENFFRQL